MKEIGMALVVIGTAAGGMAGIFLLLASLKEAIERREAVGVVLLMFPLLMLVGLALVFAGGQQ